ncbi:class I SAM-dependent methyltransferase [Bacillus sp. FJAT-50079]|uniref:class I SAM-dependent methyltransferase n=1 Tax=Bacillus sp. FJAT-50079 TaxID=2833577 RepID=UPI001BC9BCF3|nr:class I SAM-dependent methyltransferase [Bacillus sp. FJAT-50079]MBS4209474.1 class I SAM-dependent methyltransferase [Bacillus sp. FJAT-50079]
MDKSKLVRKFDKQAGLYEKQRKTKNLEAWRRQLLLGAEGKVLELAVGAGANFAYYSSDVKVTAVDFSPQMLDKAKIAAKEQGIDTEFILSDIETLEFPEKTFDTIVSTLSFCAYEHPVKVLNQLSHWCKPQGQILLMEHGLSFNPVVGFVQKVIDPIHFKLIGCHQKRDMLRLIQESDLQLRKVESHWWGMFHLIWATPGRIS